MKVGALRRGVGDMLIDGHLLAKITELSQRRDPLIVIVVHESGNRDSATKPIHNNQRAAIRRAASNPNSLFFPIAYGYKNSFNRSIRADMPADRTFDELFHSFYLFSRGQSNTRHKFEFNDRFADYDAHANQLSASSGSLNVLLMGTFSDACVAQQLGHLHDDAIGHRLDLTVYSCRDVLHFDESETTSEYPQWLNGMIYSLKYRNGSVTPFHSGTPGARDTRYQIPDTRYQIPDTRYQIPDINIRFYKQH
ncbi:Uncharacterised protein [BD1-7 clade bacterium]|uniref:Uncharacterized protein n=1 Tax=BD1-7 clade bacterium TaxID=2029982 RepID=A0A5S9NYF5_9GAMM|nr:Uncharacterised protein [BD1-7 clade bacterium]CAA0095744.1 Uncharacterised protein [BD1-7 clade bacterium]